MAADHFAVTLSAPPLARTRAIRACTAALPAGVEAFADDQPGGVASAPNSAVAAGFASSSLPLAPSTISTASAATWNSER